LESHSDSIHTSIDSGNPTLEEGIRNKHASDAGELALAVIVSSFKFAQTSSSILASFSSDIIFKTSAVSL